jgi:hypothetical protein
MVPTLRIVSASLVTTMDAVAFSKRCENGATISGEFSKKCANDSAKNGTA